ncbi:MAG: SprB repeat-containing protein [Bacteroidetes bacterium]|nr:SprB repeat-containing protein [Bacteroidota bacterium]
MDQCPGDTIDSLNTSITALAGWYYVTVTDSNGCTKLDSAQITEPAIMVATASGINVSCNGQSNGSASVVTTGGVAPYSYAWNNGASQSMTANLSWNIYSNGNRC